MASKVCAFCGLGNDDISTANCGPLLDGKLIQAHLMCMKFNSRLTQYKEELGFGGFKIQEVVNSFNAGKSYPCAKCMNVNKKERLRGSGKGASGGCAVGTCRKAYHYPCAPITEKLVRCKRNGREITFYRVWCSEKHREQDLVKLDKIVDYLSSSDEEGEPPAKAKKRTKKKGSSVTSINNSPYDSSSILNDSNASILNIMEIVPDSGSGGPSSPEKGKSVQAPLGGCVVCTSWNAFCSGIGCKLPTSTVETTSSPSKLATPTKAIPSAAPLVRAKSSTSPKLKQASVSAATQKRSRPSSGDSGSAEAAPLPMRRSPRHNSGDELSKNPQNPKPASSSEAPRRLSRKNSGESDVFGTPTPKAGDVSSDGKLSGNVSPASKRATVSALPVMIKRSSRHNSGSSETLKSKPGTASAVPVSYRRSSKRNFEDASDTIPVSNNTPPKNGDNRRLSGNPSSKSPRSEAAIPKPMDSDKTDPEDKISDSVEWALFDLLEGNSSPAENRSGDNGKGQKRKRSDEEVCGPKSNGNIELDHSGKNGGDVPAMAKRVKVAYVGDDILQPVKKSGVTAEKNSAPGSLTQSSQPNSAEKNTAPFNILTESSPRKSVEKNTAPNMTESYPSKSAEKNTAPNVFTESDPHKSAEKNTAPNILTKSSQPKSVGKNTANILTKSSPRKSAEKNIAPNILTKSSQRKSLEKNTANILTKSSPCKSVEKILLLI